MMSVSSQGQMGPSKDARPVHEPVRPAIALSQIPVPEYLHISYVLTQFGA